MAQTITFTVNGQSRTVVTDPDKPLLSVLREDLKLTGTKFGCGEGQCRACTVLVDGEPMASCITPAGDVNSKQVITIEGLARGDKLHPVQEAFLAENAFQCAYCTAGMIMGTVALLRKTAQPTEAQIRASLEKHICRCGTYPRIIRAVRRAANQGGRL